MAIADDDIKRVRDAVSKALRSVEMAAHKIAYVRGLERLAISMLRLACRMADGVDLRVHRESWREFAASTAIRLGETHRQAAAARINGLIGTRRLDCQIPKSRERVRKRSNWLAAGVFGEIQDARIAMSRGAVLEGALRRGRALSFLRDLPNDVIGSCPDLHSI